MTLKKHVNIFLVALTCTFAACNGGSETKETKETTVVDTAQKNEVVVTPPAIKEEKVMYAAGSTNMIGFAAWDSSSNKKRPIVLVVPEWWGLNDYTKSRVRQLAELGYLAIATDFYGNGAVAEDPGMAQKMSGPFYGDPKIGQVRFDAALAKIKTFTVADTNQVAAIGYCFGGAQVLNMAKLGEKLSGVVSFHGNLNVVPAKKDLLKTPILVCHGDSDQFVKPEEVAVFKKQMDSIGATYTFKSYAGATHAFTNPNATAVGEKFKMPIRYNAAADTASWKDMKDFFGTIFR